MKTIPIPSSNAINTLLHHATTVDVESTSTPAVQSVQCAHLINPMAVAYCLLLWVISYWAEVSCLHAIRQSWIDAERSLEWQSQSWRKVKGPDSQNLVQQAYMMLGILPWIGFILGSEIHEKIDHLATYMMQEWLSDVHGTQMLELLWSAVHWQKASVEVEIEGPYFYHYLKSALEAGESKYKDSASFIHARSLGRALRSGQHTSVGFITNVCGNHWVSTVVDFMAGRILYGDSLGGQPENEFISAIQWWIQYHTNTQFVISELMVPRQEDSFSCGILAFNVLAHFYLPKQYPLMDTMWIGEERLKNFLEIGRRHLNHVG